MNRRQMLSVIVAALLAAGVPAIAYIATGDRLWLGAFAGAALTIEGALVATAIGRWRP